MDMQNLPAKNSTTTYFPLFCETRYLLSQLLDEILDVTPDVIFVRATCPNFGGTNSKRSDESESVAFPYTSAAGSTAPSGETKKTTDTTYPRYQLVDGDAIKAGTDGKG